MSFTGKFKFMFLDARGDQFQGKVDVNLKHTVLASARFSQRNFDGSKMLETPALESTPDGRYNALITSARHRPVGQFLQVLDGRTSIQVFKLPIDCDAVKSVRFPKFNDLPEDLKQLLQQSQVEGKENLAGGKLYDDLKADSISTAGLLNIHAKMRATLFGNGRSVASYMTNLTRVRGDRFFAKVQVDLRDAVKNALLTGLFHEVSGALHNPPPGFVADDSFKTSDSYGNLQLTFFRKQDALEFLVDADLDDAQGFEHIFQVVGNALSNGTTNPYNIQQILLAHQGVDPGYELVV